MIRFKKAAAEAVPTPPPDYATLFVDAATGQPAAKDSAGVVVTLKGADGAPGTPGTGVPADGTVGQVLTKTGDGAAWADAPAGGGGEPAGTWVSLLPPDGEAESDFSGGSLGAAAVAGQFYSGAF